MLGYKKKRVAFENQILSMLTDEEYERLAPSFEVVELIQGQVLFVSDDTIHHVYFPNSGMASLVLITEVGAIIEVGMVGKEGMLGIPIILGANTMPQQVEVQIAGSAIRIRADVLHEEFIRGGSLQMLLLRYTNVLIAQLSQAVVCNHFHTVGQRLSKWLLLTRDRIQSNVFKLTQEGLSEKMGSHRPNVTVAARALQKAGLIRYNRGQVTILDQKGLESAACECYKTIREKIDELSMF